MFIAEVPPGKFLEASRQELLSCPQGTYKSSYVSADDHAATACTACPYGSVTRQVGSVSAADCMVPPGYFVRALQQSGSGLNVDQNGSNDAAEAAAAAAAAGEMVKCPTTPAGSTEEGYYR
jgi:hypothetical protein